MIHLDTKKVGYRSALFAPGGFSLPDSAGSGRSSVEIGHTAIPCIFASWI